MSSDYQLDEAPARFDRRRAHRWICEESYWAEGIPYATFETSLENSLVIGAFAASGEMVAMARVITDRATFAWICDVFVDAGHRGRGLGKRLIAHLMAHPDLQGLRRLALATRDAHGLYQQFGFAPPARPENAMELRDYEAYRR
jgi:GNAT superfamily N-acetyltransferase